MFDDILSKITIIANLSYDNEKYDNKQIHPKVLILKGIKDEYTGLLIHILFIKLEEKIIVSTKYLQNLSICDIFWNVSMNFISKLNIYLDE